jgi:hypothetical protein
MTCVRCRPRAATPNELQQTDQHTVRPPALDSTQWIVVVFDRQGRVTGTNIYYHLDALFEALDAINTGAQGGEDAAGIAGEYAEVHVPVPLGPHDHIRTARYVAGPDRRTHIRDDERDPGDGVDGYTICDKTMKVGELWLDVPFAHATNVCGDCTAGSHPCQG